MAQKSWAATFILVVLVELLAAPHAEAATCTEVTLTGPFKPGRLMQCRNGLSVRKVTDPTSCPKGWKIWAPESRDDWATVIRSKAIVRNPHLLVDVSSPIRNRVNSPMNSNNPAAQNWRTTNGEPWWIRSTGFSEPSGNYDPNCFLYVYSYSDPDNIRFDDRGCPVYSKDYLCQPISKVNCENRTNDITGPCANENAIWRHSNCSQGVCPSDGVLAFKGETTIEECKKACEDGRTYGILPDGLKEETWLELTGGKFVSFQGKKAATTKIVTSINYPHRNSFKNRGYHFYMKWTGHILIKTAGKYHFYIRSDDGSKMKINGRDAVLNGGWHGMVERRGEVQLSAGSHPVELDFYQGGGGGGMIWSYAGPDTANRKVVVPKSALSQGGGAKYVLPSPFEKVGACMGYSFTADETCILYSACPSVKTKETMPDYMNFLGSKFDNFKTCKMDPVQKPTFF